MRGRRRLINGIVDGVPHNVDLGGETERLTQNFQDGGDDKISELKTNVQHFQL